MSTDQTPALARAGEADNNGVGWYEVIHPTAATTLLAYVHEDGSVYFPETNDGRAEFDFASTRGKVHRLVRADDVEHARAVVSAALHDPDDPDWLAKLLAEAHGFRAGGLFFDGQMPDDSAGSVSAMRDKYRRQAAALTSKILGEA